MLLLLVALSISLRVSNTLAQNSIAQANTSAEATHPTNQSGTIKGIVLDAATSTTLVGVNVFILNSQLGAASSILGSFEIQDVPVGDHLLEASMIGFEPVRIPVRITGAGQVLTVSLELKEEAVALNEIVVTPESSPLNNNIEAFAPRTFEKEELQNMPSLGGDVYRAMTRVPGVTAGDFSSKFMIRGGEHDEVLVLLDGLELYDPFHMKDVGGGGVSIIDNGTISNVNLMTGAFTANYGNRLSGVFDIQTEIPSKNEAKSSIGISFINARATTQGALKNGKTSWMVIGRRGYIDMLLGVVDGSYGFVPQYYDVFGKVHHTFNQKHSVSLQWLNSGDKLAFQPPNDLNDNGQFKYGNTYLWANWQSIWNNRLFSTTVLSNGIVWRDRAGQEIRDDQMIRFLAKDVRRFNISNLKQDWTFDLSPTYMLNWGLNIKHYASSYSNFSTRINQTVPDPVNDPFYVHTYYDEVNVEGELSGMMTSAYAQQRVHIGSRLTTDVGAHAGVASWTKDAFIEPRINAAYRLGNQTVVRGGWGHFHQVQGIEQLEIQDGELDFHKAQRAEHAVLGFEHQFNSGISINLELYHKSIENIRPRYISLIGDAARFFPEISPDRRRIHPEAGRSRGLELLVKRENKKLNWWASYTLSNTEEKIDGIYIPKTFDQKHAFNIDINYRPTSNLHINMAWEYHTGWRYTDINLNAHQLHAQEFITETFYGQYNGERFPGYHRMDFRISYDFQLKHNKLASYLEVRNVYNQQNLRTFTYEPTSIVNSVSISRTPEHWLPILPAIGLQMDISH